MERLIKLKYRGAPLSEFERKQLNLKAGRLIKDLGIKIAVTENKFDVLRKKHGYVGFAQYYLRGCYDDSALLNKAENKIYKKLLEIDSKLGTTQTEQLFSCVFHSVRMDLIKVSESGYLLFKFLNFYRRSMWRKLILVMLEEKVPRFTGRVSKAFFMLDLD